MVEASQLALLAPQQQMVSYLLLALNLALVQEFFESCGLVCYLDLSTYFAITQVMHLTSSRPTQPVAQSTALQNTFQPYCH